MNTHTSFPKFCAFLSKLQWLVAECDHRGLVVDQEPFRRGYGRWEPVAADFVADLRGSLAGGAAGWCFHNGGQRASPDNQPRRFFDMRRQRLFDQLDEEERKAIELLAAELRRE